MDNENYEKLFPIIRPHFKGGYPLFLNFISSDISDSKHQKPDNRRLRGYLVKINDEFATALIERPDSPGVFDEVELKRIG